jgi:hypothetical protein
MFHAINARLARLARRITARQALPFEYATWHGWDTRNLGRGTWEFRDPRFAQLAHGAPAPAPRTWAQEAITGRIRSLSTPSDHTPVAGRGA